MELNWDVLGPILTIIASNAALFIWARTEGGADRREIAQLIREIQNEMKDFHGRLVKLETEAKLKIR